MIICNMSSKSKTTRREHSSDIIAVIISLHNLKKSDYQIADHVKLAKFTVIFIIHRSIRDSQYRSSLKKRSERSCKLDARARRALIRHVKTNSHDNLLALITFSKADQQISKITVRRYLKTTDYLRFKARKKSFLNNKHKQARLKWAKKHADWTMKNWYRVIWTNEITFETELDTRFCYATRKKETVMKSRYLKLIFKSEKTTVDIWEGIALRLKESVHILTKKKRMNSDIYISEILKELRVSFYERCIDERNLMLWMNDEIAYHISKKISKYRDEVVL